MGSLVCYGHLVLATEIEAEQKCVPLEEARSDDSHTGGYRST